MIDYETNLRITEIKKSIDGVKESIDRLATIVKPEKELWDNSDLIRNWKVSERTLATWRKNGIIKYVQVKDKIWYPREAREEFLKQNLIQY
jgi:hypothetical protein